MGIFNSQDTSDLTIAPEERVPLLFDDALLLEMTKLYSAVEVSKVPGFRYWDCPEEHRMSQSNNICGHQQRAWEFYWAVRAVQECRGVALGIGTGGVGAPAMLTTDKYNEGETPHAKRYPGGNQNSNMPLDADMAPWPFFAKSFGVVIFNHSFEHLYDQDTALAEALRVTKQGGYVCILQPDMTYSKRGSIDPTHTTEWCADAFLQHVQSIQAHRAMTQVLDEEGKDHQVRFEILEHNTLKNDFSFDTVLQVV